VARRENARQRADEQIWLVWLRTGDWGDTDLMAARRSPDGARNWCNDHRKLEGGGDPVQWKPTVNGEFAGTSANAVLDLGRGGKLKVTYHYFLQPMTLGD
jgi:hypothetical protein